MWNGAAASLKANPTSRSASPIIIIGCSDTAGVANRSPMTTRLVEPVAP